MPRKLIGGLIQCSNPINDESVPVALRMPPTARMGA